MDLLEKEWFIQAPWGKLSIVAWGDCCDPPVLLCHGSMDSALSFRPLVKLLPRTFYYIGLELPGHGKSDRFPPGLMISVYDLVYAIEAVAKHFRWKNFVFLGHSMGSALGKIYNISYPKKISKLIELDPINFYGVNPEEFATWYKMFFTNFYDNYEKYNMPVEKGPVLKRIDAISSLVKKRGIPEELAAILVDRSSQPAGHGLIRYTFDLRNKLINGPPFTPEHLRRIFTNVKTPILTIATESSLENSLFGNTTFLLDEKAYPGNNLRFKKVPGNHDVHVVDPKVLAGFVSQFLMFGLEGLDSKGKL